jgi:hypothetical protein
MVAEGGAGLFKRNLVEDVHMLNDASLEHGVCKLFVCWMLSIRQKFFNSISIIGIYDPW